MAKADRFTQADKANQVYSDFLTDLNTHPVTRDVVRFVNEQAVVRSIKNLLLTNRGERLYQPDIGASISKMLFEPMGSATAIQIANLARETIAEHEPRAMILDIEAIPVYERNLYVINVTILVINKQEPISFDVTLTRVR